MPDSHKQDADLFQGWIELLFRKNAAPKPTNFSQLLEKYYERKGSILPMCEYCTPFDVYRQFKDPNEEFPQGLKSYDIINFCGTEQKRIVTVVLLPPDTIKKWERPDCYAQCIPDTPLGIMTLPRMFDSFYLKYKNE
jgi:hypothetical protein